MVLDAAGELQSRAWVRRSALGREMASQHGWLLAGPRRGAGTLGGRRSPGTSSPADGCPWWTLYSGVGLFAGALAGEVGSVDAVEGDPRAVSMARRNLHDLPSVAIHQAPVGSWLAERLALS